MNNNDRIGVGIVAYNRKPSLLKIYAPLSRHAIDTTDSSK